MAKVQINFKSGISMVMKVEDLSWTRSGSGEVTSLEWKNASPAPLTMVLREIESVWEL